MLLLRLCVFKNSSCNYNSEINSFSGFCPHLDSHAYIISAIHHVVSSFFPSKHNVQKCRRIDFRRQLVYVARRRPQFGKVLERRIIIYLKIMRSAILPLYDLHAGVTIISKIDNISICLINLYLFQCVSQILEKYALTQDF